LYCHDLDKYFRYQIQKIILKEKEKKKPGKFNPQGTVLATRSGHTWHLFRMQVLQRHPG
jgi:hypothetical protein